MEFFNPETLFTVENLVALLTLFALEVVLGVDNIIFLTILADKLPPAEQPTARNVGISLAVIGRVVLLLAISWVISLAEAPLILGYTGRDLILLGGGLFLLYKATKEIHHKLEDEDEAGHEVKGAVTLRSVLIQVLIIDLVFSVDSVITAIGVTNQFPVMFVAIIAAAGIMLRFAGFIGDFVKEHPTMKILALSFLILIGSLLVFEGLNHEAAKELHIKNYIYFAMAFSFGVELLNMRLRNSKQKPVKLNNQPTLPKPDGS